MKTCFIFIRHAHSVAKEQGIVQGHGKTIPLSKLGIKQAKELGESLKNQKFDRLFTSTSIRAVETAKEIRMRHPRAPYEEIEALHERSKGTAEGMKQEEFSRIYPDIITAWGREEDPRPPGGESFVDVEKRVMPILEDHCRQYRGKRLLYVIHGNVIRVILGALLSIPPGKRHRFAQDCCGMSIVEFDDEHGRWSVLTVNNHLHV